ncbi:hypothetical protein M422DRAFT_252582 [Sphaerobolus stellatus SS14]|uniref:rRNA-processing protein FYV7 n=1 Tax=Sphaerobolus stellatus (strain SS14) TaxID=990650 RepID=A0A0C9VZT1_SPHS4|nr:hypothetical protein M422DRAFT_252582 [Sphaerobolus stellatus SS14]
MTPSPRTPSQAQKRKGPPEFRHLPAERAKKLKKEWIEKKKIKGKWKAQTRKEGVQDASLSFPVEENVNPTTRNASPQQSDGEDESSSATPK